MSERMTCPGCDSHTSSVLVAYQAGGPCPYCGLSWAAIAEIERIQHTRAGEELKAELAETIKARDAAERRAATLGRKLDRVRRALDSEA